MSMVEVYLKVGLITLLICVCVLFSYSWSPRFKTAGNSHLLGSLHNVRIVNNNNSTLEVSKTLPVENGRFTVNTKGAILWTHFPGGLSNQRIRMKDGIYLAATLKRPVVLASWIQYRPKFMLDRYYNYSTWKRIPINRVFDVEYLIQCLAKLNITALYPCLPDTCLPGFVPPRLLTRAAIYNGQNISLPFVVADFDPFIGGLPPRESTFRHGIDACITWSHEIQSLGQKLIEKIKVIAGSTDLSTVFGLHLRVEEDFASYIMLSQLYEKTNYTVTPEIIRTEIVNTALNCFTTHLKHVNFSQSWVYIATGEPKNSSRLTSVFNYFPLVITKERLSQALGELEIDFRAAVDSFILEQLSFFVGFTESTFAVQVAENRRLKYFPSALYILRSSNNCARSDIWERW